MLLVRVVRDLEFRNTRVRWWFPPADLLNLLSIVVTLLGVFVVPVLDIGSDSLPEEAFGLGLLLLAGYPFALGFRYNGPATAAPPPKDHVPRDEKLVVAIVAVVAACYVTLTVIR